MPDFASGELHRDGGQKGRWHMGVYAEPHPGSCLSVLTALLFSFLSPALGAQEISLLLVSRVSLLCDPLLSGGVALESSLLPLFCLERPFFVGRELHK